MKGFLRQRRDYGNHAGRGNANRSHKELAT